MPISKEGCAGLRTEMCVCTPGLKLPQGSFQSHTPEAVGSRPGLRPGGIHPPAVPSLLNASSSRRRGVGSRTNCDNALVRAWLCASGSVTEYVHDQPSMCSNAYSLIFTDTYPLRTNAESRPSLKSLREELNTVVQTGGADPSSK